MKPRGWSATDVGQKRDHNEDSFLCSDELGLYAVADGMGGHLGGEQASRMAIEVLEREMSARLLPTADGPQSASVAEAMREATVLASRMASATLAGRGPSAPGKSRAAISRSSTSIAIRLACSPPKCPPMPSATA